MQISVGCVCPPAARSCGCRPSSSHRTPPVFLSLATTTTSKDNWPHNLKLSLHHHPHSALSSWPRIGPANIVMTEMRCCDTLNLIWGAQLKQSGRSSCHLQLRFNAWRIEVNDGKSILILPLTSFYFSTSGRDGKECDGLRQEVLGRLKNKSLVGLVINH